MNDSQKEFLEDFFLEKKLLENFHKELQKKFLEEFLGKLFGICIFWKRKKRIFWRRFNGTPGEFSLRISTGFLGSTFQIEVHEGYQKELLNSELPLGTPGGLSKGTLEGAPGLENPQEIIKKALDREIQQKILDESIYKFMVEFHEALLQWLQKKKTLGGFLEEATSGIPESLKYSEKKSYWRNC